MSAVVDIIVVTYDSAKEIGDCIAASIAAAEVGQIVVVDNASGDSSVDTARTAGASVIIENDRNLGFARAVNQGLAVCGAPYVLLLNPDAVILGDSLARLVEALEADMNTAMAGPLLVDPSGEVILGARRFSTALNRTLWHLPLPWRPAWSTPEYQRGWRRRMSASADTTVAVDYLWGAALLARRTFLEEIGGLDERFFLYSEDEDLGRQAHARGLRSVLVPAAVVRHVGGASSSDKARAQARIEASNARLLVKWEGGRAARVFTAGIGPVLALRALLLAAAGRGEEARLAWRTCRLIYGPCRRSRGSSDDRSRHPSHGN